MQDLQRVILVHYHEIGLKGHNRSKFEKRLVKNLEALLGDYPVVTIHRISGRLIVFLKEGCDKETAHSCAKFISRIPGVARVSCGFKCDRDMDIMGSVAVRSLEEAMPFSSFKVHARRAHTDFPIDSMQMNRDIGAVLCQANPDARVIMKDPDVTVGVEVVQNAVYVYAFSIRGIGGLPVGASGKVMCLLSSGIDSPVALWRMARRGARCFAIHFSGSPETSDASEFLVQDIAAVLDRYGCIADVYTVDFGGYQKEIALRCPPELRVILYRRLMFKVAQAVADRLGAGALVTGESLGQVASQTLSNIRCTDAAVDMPVLRPLIGTDKQEIIYEAQDLGTFEISTEDAPDCCTLFMPRNPETHGKLSVVKEAESLLDEDAWIEEILSSIRVERYPKK